MALKFSQRIGKTPIRNTLQSEGMDDELRAGLWNCFQESLVAYWKNAPVPIKHLFLKNMWHDFFKKPIDTIQTGHLALNMDTVRQWFFKAEWCQVYDFIEYLSQEPKDIGDEDSIARLYFLPNISSFSKMCNKVLEREMSAYRIVKGQIMRITDEQEIEAIEAAVSQTGPWSTPAEHIQKSAALLFDRKNADYPNAIKEAISAVESACCIVTGQSGSTLGQTLKEVERKHPLHGALKEAFSKLYGYTSDAGGIRHGSIDLAIVTFEEAKYMLVACSAFVNYLKGISAQGA